MNAVKAAAKAIAQYLAYNPGAATIVGGWVVLVAARAGLHVTAQQLYVLAMALLPLVAGGHVAARRHRAKQGNPERKILT